MFDTLPEFATIKPRFIGIFSFYAVPKIKGLIIVICEIVLIIYKKNAEESSAFYSFYSLV